MHSWRSRTGRLYPTVEFQPVTSRPRLAAPGPVRELYVELDAAAEAGAAAAPATDLTNNDDDPLSDLPEQLPRPVDCRGRLPREADRHHLRPERRIKRPVPNGALARLLVPTTSRMLQEVDALDEVLSWRGHQSRSLLSRRATALRRGFMTGRGTRSSYAWAQARPTRGVGVRRRRSFAWPTRDVGVCRSRSFACS